MRCISVNYNIDATFKIKGFDNYVLGKDKQLYNIQRGVKIKRCIVGYTKGYYLNGKFHSLNKLKSLLTKIEIIKTPF